MSLLTRFDVNLKIPIKKPLSFLAASLYKLSGYFYVLPDSLYKEAVVEGVSICILLNSAPHSMLDQYPKAFAGLRLACASCNVACALIELKLNILRN